MVSSPEEHLKDVAENKVVFPDPEAIAKISEAQGILSGRIPIYGDGTFAFDELEREELIAHWNDLRMNPEKYTEGYKQAIEVEMNRRTEQDQKEKKFKRDREASGNEFYTDQEIKDKVDYQTATFDEI